MIAARTFVAGAAALVLGACASAPGTPDRTPVDALVAERIPAPAKAEAAEQRQPTLPNAIALALAHNPTLAGEYARLGLAEADVFEAGRLANPTYGYSNLGANGSAPHPQITQSFGIAFADLLLMPARKRLAENELMRERDRIAAAAIALSAEVEHDWYGAVAAQQIAAVRQLAADAADSSAQLAQRFHDAGNISVLQLNLELAAASETRIEAARARAGASAARLALATRVGGWPELNAATLTERLALPPEAELPPEQLKALARDQRLDLRAARNEIGALEDALATKRRFRLLGDAKVGVAHEHDTDGAHLTGPMLELQLPIFQQGQGSIARATAELEIGRARLAALELETDQGVGAALGRMEAASAAAGQYRTALVPQREAVVRETQHEVNYMLVGVFELLRAKRESISGYQGYLEALRDYWQARADLRRVLGARLPDDDATREPAPALDQIEGTPAPEHHEHRMPATGNNKEMDHEHHPDHDHGDAA